MLGDLFAQENEFEDVVVTTPHNNNDSLTRKLVKPVAGRSESGFVGLENQGATCYLNALIQVIFMTPELRMGLFTIDPEELGLSLVLEELTKSTIVPNESIEADESLLSTLLSFGVAELQAKRALVATKNGTLEQLLDYISQHEHDPEFNKPDVVQSVEDGGQRRKKKARVIPLELQKLFAQLQLGDRLAVSTHELTTKGFEWQGMDGQVQHDAHELNRLLIDAMERSLKHTSGEALCGRLYRGRLVNQIRCLHCGGVSEREEAFYDLNMQVTGCDDLAQSLRQHCMAELLQGESAYECGACNAKRSALRCCVLRSVPPVLTFSCSRFRIDKSTNWQRVKVTSSSEFPLLLDMRRFSEGSGGINGEQLPGDGEERYLSSLRQSMLRVEDAVQDATATATRLVETHGSSVTLQSLSSAELRQIDSEVLLRQYLTNQTQNQNDTDLFQLHAVIMHRGSAHSGHYFAYIRDNLREGMWSTPVEETKPSKNDKKKTKSEERGAAKHTPVWVGSHKKIDVSPLKSQQKAVNAPIAISAESGSGSGVLQYVVDQASRVVFVEDGSALSHVLKVLNEHKQQQQPMKQQVQVNVKGGKSFTGGKGQQKPTAAAVTAAGMPLNNLGREVAKLFPGGEAWNKVHRQALGTLESFLERHCAVLDTHIAIKGSSVALKAGVVVRVVPHAEYSARENSLASRAAAPTDGLRDGPQSEDLPSHSNVDEADEALARSLQALMDQESQRGSHSLATEEGEWETAGKKKSSKVADKTGGTSQTPVVSEGVTTEDPECTAAASEAETKLASVVALRDEILGRCYGQFFEFNDSLVSPMRLSSLEKAFSGLDSAYLLVYRRCSLEVPATIVPPPSHWVNEVAKSNRTLAEERIMYETARSSIKLFVRCPAHLRYDSPFLVPIQAEDGAPQVVVLEVNGRSSVEETIDEFCAQHFDQLREWGLGSSCLQLSRLDQYGEQGFHVRDEQPLSRTAVISESLEGATTVCHNVLLWDGVTIGGQRVLAGPAGLPRRLTVRKLDLVAAVAGQAKSKVPVVRVCESLDSHWVPYSLTLSELCYSLANKLGLDPFRAVVHAVESKHETAASNATTRSKSTKVDKVLSATLLFESGTVVERTPAVVVSAGAGKKSGGKKGQQSAAMVSTSTQHQQQRVFREDTCVGELDWAADLLVEDCESRGLHSSALADLFAAQKNAEVTVLVELDMVRKEVVEEEGGSGVSLPSVAVIEINRNCTLLDLKLQALASLQLDASEYRDSTRLRSGVNRGEGVFEDEGVVLSASSDIHSGCTVYLERGAQSLPDTVSLQALQVVNNSTAFKYEASQSGDRVGELEISVKLTDSLTSVRDQLGVLFYKLPPGWTALLVGADHAPPMGLRLRRTSWLKEFADLLTECDDKGRALTVGDAGLRGGDTVLLEEGLLPVRGQITFQLYLWNNAGGAANGVNSVFDESSGPVEAATQRRKACLLPLGSLDCQDELLLADLQALVFGVLSDKAASIQDSISNWEVPRTVDHFLVRELRSDLLPGRSLWTCAAPAATQDYNSIGRGGAAAGKSGFSTAGSLKRLGLSKETNKGRNLVVECLSDTQVKVRPPAGAFRVWVQQLLNPGADEGFAIMAPTWPPRQVLVNGGVAPSLMHLKRPIVQEFAPQLTLERVVVFKFNPDKIEWSEVHGGDKSGKKVKKENICQAPHYLQEGDQLCAFESLPQSAAKGGCSSSTSLDLQTVRVALPEDMCLRADKEAARRERAQNKKKSSGGVFGEKNHAVARRVEVGLSLGGNFDFSDDEEVETLAATTRSS